MMRGMTYDEAKIAEVIRIMNAATFGIILGDTKFSRDRAITAILTMELSGWITFKKWSGGLIFSLTAKGEQAYLKWIELPF